MIDGFLKLGAVRIGVAFKQVTPRQIVGQSLLQVLQKAMHQMMSCPRAQFPIFIAGSGFGRA